jgi:HD-GYP domain-containing protein (c-di-GMP phosphodiesterase class II)
VADDVRLADLLAALSLATDFAMGQPAEKAIRATVVAIETAQHLGLSRPEVADTYYTTLLKHLGCTATMHEEVYLFGPDIPGMRRIAERTDETDRRESFALMRTTGRGAGLGRPRYLLRAARAGRASSSSIYRGICEVASRMASRLELGGGVVEALSQTIERWDGRGEPRGLRGEDIALSARIAEPATQAVIFHGLGGVDAAMDMVRRRAGGWFDPAVAEALRAVGPSALERLEHLDPWEAVQDAEPEPVRRIALVRLDVVAGVFADLADLVMPYTMGHSPGVAELAASAGERLGLTDLRALRLAALLHDLGRTAVSAGVWEKPGPLTTGEWEQVRLHPYTTERILARSDALEPIARIAGMHHERRDGSGYHRGASAAEVPPESRLLAAADAFQAMTQARPHRPALVPERAASELEAQARAGRLDPECVGAVVECAGQRRGRIRTEWPARLSDREVEVLRLVARGRSNRDIAIDLVISPRTAEHHVQHVYAKIGVSTRAGAALFALEHGLLRD